MHSHAVAFFLDEGLVHLTIENNSSSSNIDGLVHIAFASPRRQEKSVKAYWKLFGGTTNFSVVAENTIEELSQRLAVSLSL